MCPYYRSNMSTNMTLTTRTPSSYEEEAKPRESKLQESKLQESKLQEAKSQEAKSQEAKSQEAKPQEAKPQEACKASPLQYESKCPHGEHFYACPCCS